MPITQLHDGVSLIFFDYLRMFLSFTPCCVRRKGFRAARSIWQSVFFCVFDEVMNWSDEAELLRDFWAFSSEVGKLGVSNPFVEADAAEPFLKSKDKI